MLDEDEGSDSDPLTPKHFAGVMFVWLACGLVASLLTCMSIWRNGDCVGVRRACCGYGEDRDAADVGGRKEPTEAEIRLSELDDIISASCLPEYWRSKPFSVLQFL